MELSQKEIEELKEEIAFGKKAEVVSEVIHKLCNSIIERCKNEFATLPIIDYQNIDNSRVFMLQFEMKIAKDFATAIDAAIYSGQSAEQTLLEAFQKHGRT